MGGDPRWRGHGACDDAREDYPEPRYGRPDDRRPDLLQIPGRDRGRRRRRDPVYHRANDDGAAEVSGAMTALKKPASR